MFERGGKPEIAVEIKRSSAPTLSRGFHGARQALNVKESYLVHGGTDTWPESDGVTAIGLVEPDAIRLLQRMNLPRELAGAEGKHVLVHGEGSFSRMNNRQ